MRGTPQNPEFIYKKLCLYSYMFKIQSPSKYSPLNAIHILKLFFHCSKQFLNSLILMPFSASAVFVLPLPQLQNHFPATILSGGLSGSLLTEKTQEVIFLSRNFFLFFTDHLQLLLVIKGLPSASSFFYMYLTFFLYYFTSTDSGRILQPNAKMYLTSIHFFFDQSHIAKKYLLISHYLLFITSLFPF